MAAYQREATVGRAIESVLVQSRAADEIIVVDDGSTDGTADVVRGFAPHVHLVTQSNRERGAARNSGVKVSTGAVIAFLDSDDEWAQHHLETLMPAFDNDVSVVHTQAEMFDDVRGEVFFTSATQGAEWPTFRDLLLHNPVPFSASAVRRVAFEAVGGFEESRSVSGVEDWDLWIRLAAVGRVRSLPTVTARIHFHASNTVGDVNRQQQALLFLRSRVLSHPRVEADGLNDVALLGSVLRVARIRREAGEARRALAGLARELFSHPGLLATRAAWRGLVGAVVDSLRRGG